MQVEAFLARFPPFDALDPVALERIAGATQIEFFPAGATIIRQGGEPAGFLYVVRTGGVELLDDGTVIDLLEEGESFGHPSLVAGIAPSLSVRAFDDTLCYLIDRDVADEVIRTPAGVAFLARALARRGRQASLASEVGGVTRRPVPIASLLHREPVTCPPRATIVDAARRMAAERVSSVLVLGERLIGIVTDRDLRSKVIAEGLDPATPVRDVMSSPVVTAPTDTTSEDALLLMLQHGFHHVPVTDPDGRVVGVVSDTDLLGLERTASFALLRALDRSGSPDEVAAEMRRLPSVVVALVDGEVDPVGVGHVIASAIDGATRRLIHAAIADLGVPPGPWAWIALGSEARHEQSLATDQDHALAYAAQDAPVLEADAYFEELARRVADGLEASGIPRCRGGVMAESTAWRGDRDAWLRAYRTQLASVEASGSVFSNIALDHRRVAGALDVEPTIDEIVRQTAREGRLVRRLASVSLELRPPTGFFRDFVLGTGGSRAGTLDVKHGGIVPITNLARTFAVASGVSATRTIDRLRLASSLGALDAEMSLGLEEAFRLLWRIRLEHQARRFREGVPPDDDVDPAELGRLTRRSLKEAFRMIAAAQRTLATTLGLRLR